MRATLADPDAGVLVLATPEGTSVRFHLASLSDRASAFGIDFAITQLATMLISVIGWLIFTQIDAHVGMAIFFAVSFFFRNLYFGACELYWSGQTIGKRRLGLRAIARDGGPLSGQSILARNVTREIEFFAPLVAISQPRQILDLDERWALPIAGSWLALFVLLPLLNRERLRCGDLLGGTVVVAVPRPVLLDDLAAVDPRRSGAYTFTPAQLDVYGIEELQVLEQVLRRAESTPGGELTREVARRIRKKIGWRVTGNVHDGAFLRAFYQAQRAHLERKLLFGVRKEKKSR